jgi:hypothetical protein
MKTYAEWKPLLDGVDGYMASASQRELMFNIGKLVRTGIELGSYKGLSACLVAAGMRASEAEGRKLYCVDTFSMTGLDSFKTAEEMHETATDFKRFTGMCGVADLCVPVIMTTEASPEAFRELGITDADYLFVDAAHDKRSTMDNCLSHLPFLRPGAIILFHDYDPVHFQEVVSAVDELVEAGWIIKDSAVDDFWVGHKP